ncbi:nucleotide-diphospho-sugar transferase [Collybia nuda]|uniref:Nucleotide-diphospho-sugar transferase n=1 Tax=Collybia nuda TaxID=64659 RepID=A0A9P6CMN0_9AGAR|nr:nucleotide-diphospho-sugar transferase [Collybia nuda]
MPSRPRLLLFSGLAFVLVSLLLLPFSRFSGTIGLSSPLSYNAASHRPNGVIFILVNPKRITQALMALYNVEDRFNHRLKYPYVLFTAEDEADALTEEIRAKIGYITEGRATFATVQPEAWGVPDGLDKFLVDESIRKIGFSIGYRSMCRFYSGFFWRHPALARYEWLWRLDTDIEFHCDVPYDPIERVIEQQGLYGFVQVTPDASWVQPTLASNVSHFLASHASLLPPDVNLEFVWKGPEGAAKALQGTAESDDWSGMTFYNNFEISHRSIWESPAYTKLFEALDKAGGFFYERWSDAPIHSYGLAMTLRKDQVVHFGDLGYQHQKWAYECPATLSRCACVNDDVATDFKNNSDRWYTPRPW